MRQEIAKLWTLLEPPIRGLGLDLIELEWGREDGGWVLRVYIDHPWQGGRKNAASDPADPPGISYDECERVSRDLSAVLDVEDVISQQYRLEVSSPGLERPLRRAEDFRRFAGRQVKVRTTDAVDGRRNFSGSIGGVEDGVVQVECDGRSYKLPLDIIVRASLVADWDAEFRRASRGPRPEDDTRHDSAASGGGLHLAPRTLKKPTGARHE